MKTGKARAVGAFFLAVIMAALPGISIGSDSQAKQTAAPQVECVFIPIKSRGALGSTKVLRLETTIYRPDQSGRFPLVICNHGSTGIGAIPTTKTLKYEIQAKYFLSRGYAVVVPMRKGRGRSEGSYSESEKYSCEFYTWKPGINSAIEDIDGVIEYLSEQPYADVSSIVLTGISRGGFLSVAYAAEGKYRDNVKGVINFSGGWVGEGCRKDFNRWSYSRFGKLTKLRMLWLYAKGDSYYSSRAIETYFQAFAKKGGVAECHLFDKVPGDGHILAFYPSIWKTATDQYLDSLGIDTSPTHVEFGVDLSESGDDTKAGALSETKEIPLPEDMEITVPQAGLPEGIAAFSGRWEGIWDGVLSSVLIVEKIDSDKATVIFAWGDCPGWHIDSGHKRYEARVIPGKKPRIEFGGEGGPEFVFEMEESLEAIQGTREFKDYQNKITMYKKE